MEGRNGMSTPVRVLERCTSKDASSPAISEVADSSPSSSPSGGVNYFGEDELCERKECVEKLEAMLSTAIMQQEDVWNLLMLSVSEGMSNNSGTGDSSSGAAIIPPKNFLRMTEKLENSHKWCTLAQKRLKGIISPALDQKRLSPEMKPRSKVARYLTLGLTSEPSPGHHSKVRPLQTDSRIVPRYLTLGLTSEPSPVHHCKVRPQQTASIESSD